jgi:hypothetical protein
MVLLDKDYNLMVKKMNEVLICCVSNVFNAMLWMCWIVPELAHFGSKMVGGPAVPTILDLNVPCLFHNSFEDPHIAHNSRNMQGS